MRISDWSSDVCSSDLHPRENSRECGRKRCPTDPASREIHPNRPGSRPMFRSLVYVLVLGPCGHPWPNWVKKPLRPDPFAGACPETMQVQGCAERSTSQHSPLSARSEEHTSELQSLMRISYAVFCLKN